jgi:Protein of unknown function (DUF2934)
MATVKRPRSAAKAPAKAKAKPANGEQAKAASQPTSGMEEVIRVRAYELYVERGLQDGSAQEDWLRAEAEVRDQERRT